MNRHQSPADRRPFQARATLDRQQSLEAHYNRIAIDDVVAALHQIAASAQRRTDAKAA